MNYYQRWASVSGKFTSTTQYEACEFNKWERLVITGSKSNQKFLTYFSGRLLNTNNGYKPVTVFLEIEKYVSKASIIQTKICKKY